MERDYINLYETKQKTEMSSSSLEELTPKKENKLEQSQKKATTLLSLQVMGLSPQALIYGTCITLFLLVLLNLG